MNISLPSLPISPSIPGALKKKRVLLIDTSRTKRDLRGEVMRKLGIDVDSAADIVEARIWWKPDLYDLVLINMEKGRGQRDKFCDDVRGATPPQRLAFLVGRPEYLTDSPNRDQELAMESSDGQTSIGDAKDIVPADPDSTQRWGILEASRQISAVRSASSARTQAMRALPPPPRDFDGRPSETNRDTDQPRRVTEGGIAMKKLYVGNLRYSTTEAELWNLFEAQGAVEKIIENHTRNHW